jgi:hypothetical protein
VHILRVINVKSRDDESIIATFSFEDHIFSYDERFFSKNGDLLSVTRGGKSKQFESTPAFFWRYLPTYGTLNFSQAVKKYHINDRDDFDVIVKLGKNILAPFTFTAG